MNKNVIQAFGNFIRNERGTTAIEYALIASIISVAIVGVAISLGETVRDDLFGKVAAALGS